MIVQYTFSWNAMFNYLTWSSQSEVSKPPLLLHCSPALPLLLVTSFLHVSVVPLHVPTPLSLFRASPHYYAFIFRNTTITFLSIHVPLVISLIYGIGSLLIHGTDIIVRWVKVESCWEYVLSNDSNIIRSLFIRSLSNLPSSSPLTRIHIFKSYVAFNPNSVQSLSIFHPLLFISIFTPLWTCTELVFHLIYSTFLLSLMDVACSGPAHKGMVHQEI